MNNKAEHIGIYIGGGFMIHAHGDSYVHGNYAKYVVEKKNISSGYYHVISLNVEDFIKEKL